MGPLPGYLGAFDSAAVAARAAIRRIHLPTPVDFNHPERTLRKVFFHQRRRHIEDGNVRRGSPFRLTVVCMTVEDHRDREAAEWFFEAAATQKWKNLARLAFDGGLDR